MEEHCDMFCILTDTSFIMYALQLLPPLWDSFTPIVDVRAGSSRFCPPFNQGILIIIFNYRKWLCVCSFQVFLHCISAALAVSVSVFVSISLSVIRGRIVL